MSFEEADGERGRFRFNTTTGELEKIDVPKKLEVAPVFHRDEALDGIHSMLDDKIYHSKSAYKASLKEAGYEVTGGDHLQQPLKRYDPEKHEREIREAAEKAYYDIKYDRIPIDEKSKEINAREEREWKAYQQRQKTTWAR